MTVTAPYNFVPLSRWLFLPDWADQVSQDIPFADGVSGELKVRLTCHTPTLVGGEQQKATAVAPGRVDFMKDPSGNPVIPGSSLKGMLRNVLEIAGFGKFGQVADRRYGARDLYRKFYTDCFSGAAGSHAGWLKCRDGEWSITPCSHLQVRQSALIKYLEVDLWKWRGCSTAEERYKLLKGIREVRFRKEVREVQLRYQKVERDVAWLDSFGQRKGQLVVTGQPGKPFDFEHKKGKNAGTTRTNKKFEFVFFDSEDEALPVSPDCIRDFMFIHDGAQAGGEWAYWKQQKAAYSRLGVPVFYLPGSDGAGIRAIGLASMFRLAYEHSIHDAIRHTQPAHLDEARPDLAQLLFGHLDDAGEEGGLRGRVMVGAARVKGPVEYQEQRPTVLNGPKPTFYPSYIAQPVDRTGRKLRGAEYQTLMDAAPQLRGWKRYPARRGVEVMPPPTMAENRRENFKTQVILNPVEAGTRFEFSIRFHNTRPEELGALIWCLNFGNRSGLRHGLGMGKPYGLGQVSLDILGCRLSLVTGEQSTEPADLTLLSDGFTQMMEASYQQQCAESAGWEQSAEITELLAMADPTLSPACLGHLRLQPSNGFVNAKRDNAVLPSYSGAVIQPHRKPGAAVTLSTAQPGLFVRLQNAIQAAQQVDAGPVEAVALEEE